MRAFCRENDPPVPSSPSQVSSTLQTSWVLTLLAWCSLIQPAIGQPFNLSLVNLQPVNAESIIDLAYDPTVPSAQVLFEPLQRTQITIPSFRTNMDFEVRNDEPDWIRLDSLRVEYPGSPMSALFLEGDDLLGYDDTLYYYAPSNPDKKRPALVSGGFGATGLMIQRGLDKAHDVPFGRALDVVAYQPPGAASAYAVVGQRDYYIGEPPVDPEDPWSAGTTGFLARYDSNGSLRSYASFQGNSLGAITELGEGLFLALGKNIASTPGLGLTEVLTVRRLVLYEVDEEGAATFIHQITADESFGDDGWRHVAFEEPAGKPCDIGRMVGGVAVSDAAGPRYLVAASIRCGTAQRAGLALLDSDGDLVEDFGSDGTLVLSGPDESEILPVALEPRRGLGQSSVVAWLAARSGESCFASPPEDCQFGLTRLNQTGQDGDYGWQQVTFDGADFAAPSDMVVDSAGRVIVGGRARVGDLRYAALARFTPSGVLDDLFGNEGLVTTLIDERDATIAGLALTSEGEIAAAIGIYHEAEETTLSFGAARFSSSGTLLWSRDSLQEGTQWQHNLPGEHLNYGSYLEINNQGASEAIAVDDQNRFVVVGGVTSDLVAYSPGVGPTLPGLGRYLPFGVLDSRRWVKPNGTIKVVVPEDRHFPQPPPTHVNIELDFLGGSQIDWQLDREVTPVIQNAVNSNPAPGGYLFPIPASEMAFDEAAVVGAHPLKNHHRHSASNRFAHDIGIGRWDGSAWNGFVTGAADTSTNEAYRVWNRQVRAMADGMVVACRRSSEDNDPGSVSGQPANFLQIQHAFDPVDKSLQEYVSYLHLKQDSILLSVCPNICPADQPGCDVATDGVDPDGAKLPDPVPVVAGQILGRIGNSGTSTAPHLHIHLSTGAGGSSGDPVAGNIPLLFQDILLGDRYDNVGNQIEPSPWYGAHNVALPHGYLVIPED